MYRLYSNSDPGLAPPGKSALSITTIMPYEYRDNWRRDVNYDEYVQIKEEVAWKLIRKAETVLSVFDEPFVVFNDVEHVVLLGLAFEEGRGDGIYVQGGCDCLVAGCMLRRFGGDAIVVRGGQRHGIFGCTMHTLGCGGARVAGGDRRTLTPGHHFVENCTVSNISRLKRTTLSVSPSVIFMTRL